MSILLHPAPAVKQVGLPRLWRGTPATRAGRRLVPAVPGGDCERHEERTRDHRGVDPATGWVAEGLSAPARPNAEVATRPGMQRRRELSYPAGRGRHRL